MKDATQIGVLAMMILAGSGCASMSAGKSDHFDGSRYFNPGVKTDKSWWQVLKWQWTREQGSWPEWRELPEVPEDKVDPVDGEFLVTFVNHATHLIRFPGINVLTDPMYSDRASPFSFAGPKRTHAPGVSFEQLPRIDVVLISHNHFDHMDEATVRRLAEVHNPLFITPLGNRQWLEPMGAKRVVELDWWEKAPVPGTNALVTAVPAQHWSMRGPFNRNAALWSGFVIEADRAKVYFAGDSGYAPLFQEIGERFPSLDLSILPIGAYEPRWFMREQHMNPEEAVRAHQDLGSKQSMATHFGTFQMADEGLEDPSLELKGALDRLSVDPACFVVPHPGELFRYGGSKSCFRTVPAAK